MDVLVLNRMLTDIVRLKNKLASMNYNDEAYDEIEDELHDLEDELNDELGESLEDVLMDIHDDLGSDSEILLPTAYLADEYVSNGKDEAGNTLFSVPVGSGIHVDTDKDGVQHQLLLLPAPARFAVYTNGRFEKVVWTAK